MPARVHLQLLVLLAVSVIGTGCASYWNERNCPTDARAVHCGPGEEAVRRGPCGPDALFYGYKPTCWGAWPSDWSLYAFDHCGPEPCYADPNPVMAPATPLLPPMSLDDVPLPDEVISQSESFSVSEEPSQQLPNPFRTAE